MTEQSSEIVSFFNKLIDFIGIKKQEDFTNGFGFEMPESIHPIFLNMYKQQLDKDFGLFDVIQHLKYTYFNPNLDKGITFNNRLSHLLKKT